MGNCDGTMNERGSHGPDGYFRYRQMVCLSSLTLFFAVTVARANTIMRTVSSMRTLNDLRGNNHR